MSDPMSCPFCSSVLSLAEGGRYHQCPDCGYQEHNEGATFSRVDMEVELCPDGYADIVLILNGVRGKPVRIPQVQVYYNAVQYVRAYKTYKLRNDKG